MPMGWGSPVLSLLLLTLLFACGRKEEQVVDVNDLLRVEGWVMASVKGDVVTRQTFKAQPISPLHAHEGKPKGSRPVQCTSVERAVFTRIDSFTGAQQ